MRLTKPHLWDNKVFYYYPFQYIDYVICISKSPKNQKLIVHHTDDFKGMQDSIYKELRKCI